MAKDPSVPRHIVPFSGAKKTCPSRILPGSLHLFTHPAQQFTGPVREALDRRYRRPDKTARWLVAFDALVVGVVLALAATFGSLILLPRVEPLRLSVEATAAEARSGDLVGFSARYENRGKAALRDAQLALTLPDGFHVTSVEGPGEPVDLVATHNVVALGEIAPGGNGTVRISGYVLQPERATSDALLHATLTGTQDGSEVIQSSSGTTVHVSGSALKLRWTGTPAPHSVIGAPAIGQLVLENQGAATIEGLSFTTFCVPLVSCDAQEIPQISSGEDKVLGEYPNTVPLVGTDAFLSVTVNGRNIVLTSTDVSWEQAADGPLIDIQSAELFGGGTGMDVRARVASTGPALDRGAWRLFPQPWSAVDASKLPPDAEAQGIPAGSFTVASGTPSEVRFQIPLASVTSTVGLTVRAVASACVARSDACVWSSSERVQARPAGTTLVAELRYYTEEGEQIGRGPLPPRVGEKTEYWVVVHVGSEGGRLKDATLRIPLRPGVSFAGKQSTSLIGIGAPRQVGNEIVWPLGTLATPADSPATLAVALAFRPTSDMIGSDQVLGDIFVTGRDADSGLQIEAHGPSLTTDHVDARAAEKGTQVAPPLQ